MAYLHTACHAHQRACHTDARVSKSRTPLYAPSRTRTERYNHISPAGESPFLMGYAGGLRGGKFNFFDGGGRCGCTPPCTLCVGSAPVLVTRLLQSSYSVGLRVPFIVRWPGCAKQQSLTRCKHEAEDIPRMQSKDGGSKATTGTLIKRLLALQNSVPLRCCAATDFVVKTPLPHHAFSLSLECRGAFIPLAQSARACDEPPAPTQSAHFTLTQERAHALVRPTLAWRAQARRNPLTECTHARSRSAACAPTPSTSLESSPRSTGCRPSLSSHASGANKLRRHRRPFPPLLPYSCFLTVAPI
eukprot:1803757-Pleurochrysis_carterae.AAC.1